MKLKEIVKITGGRLLSGDPDKDIELSNISTDSRAVGKGSFFVALKGNNFDGNRFVSEAFRRGAIGALVSAVGSRPTAYEKIVVQVMDTTKALQDIAAHNRQKFDIPVIAVTGSNGKTTVKELIWSVLSMRFDVLKNEGTKNNHVGVPQTLLKLTARHDIAVLELGTNHPGEIKLLAGIVRPTVAVMTNIGPAHLEHFGDLEGVLKAKKEMLGSFAHRRGLVILNGDDAYLSTIAGRKLHIVRFGFSGRNDFIASAIRVRNGRISFLVNGEGRFTIRLIGMHSVYNALAAIAVGRHFGVSYAAIRRALARYEPAGMRLAPSIVNGIGIINDSYNSNPASFKSAIDAIVSYPSNAKWVVSGDMLELGPHSIDFHKAAGRYVARSGAEGFMTYGRFSRYMLSEAKAGGMDKNRLWHCSSHAEIAELLKKFVRKGDAVLLKGSRGMRMEEVLNKLKGKR